MKGGARWINDVDAAIDKWRTEAQDGSSVARARGAAVGGGRWAHDSTSWHYSDVKLN